MSGIRSFVVVAVVGWLGFAADVSQAALAKKVGGAGLSGTLSSNKAVKKQQLICDPDEPTGGSISVQYDPTIVAVSDLSFGPNYVGTGSIQLDVGDGVTTMVPLSRYFDSGSQAFGVPTGFLQVTFEEPVPSTAAAAAALLPHGQIAVADGYTTVDEDGPAAVDTHAFLFDYLPGVSDDTVATYKIFVAAQGEYDNEFADYLTGLDENNESYTLAAGQVASATVSGSLNANAVPLPPAVLAGGLTMAGSVLVRTVRRRRTA